MPLLSVEWWGISPPIRWTRPMSSELIVKLLFPVAEPAHSTRRIARGVENIADNSRDLLF